MNTTFRKFITVVMFGLIAQFALAQQAPIPIEVFAGHRAITYYHVISRDIDNSKFNFFNVAQFDAEYKAEGFNDYVILSLLSYKINNNISFGGGGQLTPVDAFAVLGAQFVHATDEILLVAVPTVNITGVVNYEQFLLFEYLPIINTNLRGYFRAQFLINTDFDLYNRGYQQFRFGLQKGNVQFGVGVTYDQYDSNVLTTSNYGVFGRLLLN